MMKDILDVIAISIYWMSKVYFMLIGIYYIYALATNNVDKFTHITGLVGILFLLSNIKWYLWR